MHKIEHRSISSNPYNTHYSCARPTTSLAPNDSHLYMTNWHNLTPKNCLIHGWEWPNCFGGMETNVMAGRTLLGLFNIPSGEKFCVMLEKRHVSAWVSLKILGVQKNDVSEPRFPINSAINWEANPSFSGKTISHSWIYLHIIYIYREREIYIYIYMYVCHDYPTFTLPSP